MGTQFLERMLAEEASWITAHDYLGHHRLRFEYLYKLCLNLKPERTARVLDVGRSFFSWKLAGYYEFVSTLGFPIDTHGFSGKPISYEGREPSQHMVFNLNDSGREAIPNTEKFDLIICAEVIEHLIVPPELPLFALGQLLSSEGVLVVQTPNAATLPFRLKLLLGANPFEMLRFTRNDPGHFREYTKAELIGAGNRAGLNTVSHDYAEYWPSHRLPIRLASKIIPQFRKGQTVVYRR